MLRKFGELYLDTDKILYVQPILPGVRSKNPLPMDNRPGVVIVLPDAELDLYEGDPGYAEFTAWLKTLS